MGAIKVLRAVLGVILCVLLGMSLWLTVQRQVFHKEELELLGVVVSPVTGDTMAPALEAGDLAVAVSGGDCSLGDAVLCQDGSFQRLVGSVDGEFIARGDSQSQEDEALLPAEQIRGRVTGVVPGGQGVWAFFGSLWGPLVILVAGIVLLALPALLGLGRYPELLEEEPVPQRRPRDSAPRDSVPRENVPREEPRQRRPREERAVPREPRRGGYRPRH